MESGGKEGFEVIANEPREFDKVPGQYTHKVVHLAKKAPAFVTVLAPRGSLELRQVSENTYPYVKTTMDNPEYMKTNFSVKVESLHKEDYGESENAHGLSAEELKQREVIFLDFVKDQMDPRDYVESEDPTKFVPEASKLGKLSADWLKDMKDGKYSAVPHVCVYKLVRAEFIWWSLQTRVEKLIHKFFRRYMQKFHRQLYCWMDKWYGLTIDDIRAFEEKTKQELAELQHSGEVRGMYEK